MTESTRTPSTLAALALVLWTALAGPASAQQDADASATLAREITALVNLQAGLIMKRDPDALAALFTEDATYVGPNGSSHTGRARIRDYYKQVFAILQYTQTVAGDMQRLTQIERVSALGDGAWALGRGANMVTGSEIAVATSDHWVAIFARAGSEWKFRVLSIGDDTPTSRR
jgi:ketosteroid isomerase-like protein